MVALMFGAGGTASAATGSDVAAKAQSQLGGQCSQYYGCPDPGEWCADFARWVWAQNGLDISGLDGRAASFYEYGARNGTLSDTPQVGDAVVFGYNGNGFAEHVAIVTSVNAANHTITSVGGNEGGGDGTVDSDPPYDSTKGTEGFAPGYPISGYIAPLGLTNAVPAQLVAIGNDGGIYHEVRDPNGIWTGFKPLTDSAGGVMKASDVAVAGDPDGSSQVVAIGGDGLVYHEVRTASGSWTGFQAIQGVGTAAHMAAKAVAISAAPDGSAQLVAIGSDGNVYHEIRAKAGNWTGFQPVTGLSGAATMAAKAISITADPDGSAQLVVIGTDGLVYHEVRTVNGAWSGFQPIKGVGTPTMLASAVSITADPDGSAQLVAVGSDGNVYHEIRAKAGNWTGFAAVGGINTSNMAATSVSITGDPDGSAQLVAVGNDGDVYHEVRQASGSWTGFQPVTGVGTPKMAASTVSISSVPGAA
jgi:hypothetical protein